MAAPVAALDGPLRLALDGDPDVVASPMRDLLAAGGKRLRPALVLLAASLGEYDIDLLLPAAMAVEVTHAATLVHDDVIDRALTRRGRPSVAAAMGNEQAIVIGDYYLVKAYELAGRTNKVEVVSILAGAVMEICAGEVRQYAMRFRYSIDDAEYMQWIHDKTAALLAACCDIGGLLGNVRSKERGALHDYGINLGLAFQIADDVLDYTGSENEMGKPIGHDLVEGFATLPFMLAVQRGAVEPLADGRRLTEDEARHIAEQVRASDAPQLAIARARELAARAREQLAGTPDTEASKTLAALTDYVVSRTF